MPSVDLSRRRAGERTSAKVNAGTDFRIDATTAARPNDNGNGSADHRTRRYSVAGLYDRLTYGSRLDARKLT